MVCPVLGGFFWPGQRNVQVSEDGPLDWCERVQDDAAWGVGEVQAVEGGQDGAGGGDGGAAFGQDAGQGRVFAEAGAQFGFDQPEDQQGDADDGDQRLDPVIVVQEDGPDPQGLFQVAVALLDDPLVFVDFQHVQGGQCGAVVVVGQVGGQRVQPVKPGGRGDRILVAVPADDGLAGLGGGAQLDQAGGLAGEDPGGLRIDLLAGLVVAAAQPIADLGQAVFGPGQCALAGIAHGGGLLRGPDVGGAQVMVAGGRVIDRERGEQAPPCGALVFGQAPLTARDVIEDGQRVRAAGDIGVKPGSPAG